MRKLNRHGGRGLRSRFVAVVAAAAMLAASVVTGTAMAAEDTTDQSGAAEPQATTQSMQTGDGADYDSANATDADAASISVDNSSSGNVTNGDSIKSSKVNSYARANLSVDSDRSKNNGIVVNLYDYCSAYDQSCNTWQDGDINRGHTLQFNDGTGSSINEYTQHFGGVRTGIVNNELGNDGYPTLVGGNESLGYLFPDSTNRNGVTKVYKNVDGLFSVDANGYYTYDSAYNYAVYNSDNTFKVYETGRFPYYEGGNLPGIKNAGAFLPFNDLNSQGELTRYYDSTQGFNGQGYILSGGDNQADYHFGMTVSADFYQPKGGQVNGEDMKFEFSGDDDVWVFVDDTLVLDLGGIHEDYSGTINFHTGDIQRQTNNRDGFATVGNLDSLLPSGWDTAYKQHTLKVFYLERGLGGSNCKFHFNLATIPTGAIDVSKKITGSNTADFTQAEFPLRVLTSATKDGSYQPYTGKYDLYDEANPNVPIQTDMSTDSNTGVFMLKNGQFARLKGDFSDNSYYKVVEDVAANYNRNDYQFDLDTTNFVDESGASQSGIVGQSKPIQVGDVKHIIVTNAFQTTNKYSFTVTKKMSEGQSAGSTVFTMKITDENGNPYNGPYELVENGDTTTSTTESGLIGLKVNQSAKITKVDPGTTFKVEEVDIPSGYSSNPDIACTRSDNQPCDSDGVVNMVTVDKNNVSPTITVTNRLDQLEAPAVSKKIKHNNWDDKNQKYTDDSYTLSLDVTGKAQTTTTTSMMPLDIVMVLDVSASMMNRFPTRYEPVYSLDTTNKNYYCYPNNGSTIWHLSYDNSMNQWYYDTGAKHHVIPKTSEGDVTPGRVQVYERISLSKLDALKVSVNKFIDSAVTANGTNRIGIITFSDNATEIQGLTDVTEQSCNNMKTEVNRIKLDSETYPSSGLNSASSMLQKARPEAKKIVLFFTDGEPGSGSFDGTEAVKSISLARQLKRDNVSVYSIGVFDGANPNDITTNFNKYMHAVSSNYLNVTGTQWQNLTLGDRSAGNYYYAASDDKALESVFQEIYQHESSTAGYTDVSIVDQLSDYAQLDNDVMCNSSDQNVACVDLTTANDVPVTRGVTVYKQDIVVSSDDYEVFYNPSTKTITVHLLNGGMLENDKTYTVQFNIRPTRLAYIQQAQDNGYYQHTNNGAKQPITGDAGTDLELQHPTSSDKPGFYSNKQAYLEYSINGEPQPNVPYQKPVLQVNESVVRIPGLIEKKTVTGSDAAAHAFNFTVKASEADAKFAGLSESDMTDTDEELHCTLNSDVYSCPNPGIESGQTVTVHKGHDLMITAADGDDVHVYTYEETMPQSWHSDVTKWIVTVQKDTTNGLQAIVKIYKNEMESANLSKTYTYSAVNGQTQNPPEVLFENAFVAVSSLPLTGGGVTGRVFGLAGGGVLLLAGLAWLLARRRRV